MLSGAAVACVTCSAHPQLCEDDQAVRAALTRHGVEFEVLVWDDPTVDWSRFALVAVRSPWDYPAKFNKFTDWLDQRSCDAPVWNTRDGIVRNQHKRYLVDLGSSGVPVVSTVVVSSPAEAIDVAREQGWQDAVVKPAIGLGGRRVTRLDGGADTLPSGAADEDWCVQPFLKDVSSEGEYSVICIDGEPSHAVLKHPASHEFRVHDGYGGTHHPTELTAELATLAVATLDALDARQELATRVDAIRDDAGRLRVIEADITSPCLYTEHDIRVADRYAAAVSRRLTRL